MNYNSEVASVVGGEIGDEVSSELVTANNIPVLSV